MWHVINLLIWYGNVNNPLKLRPKRFLKLIFRWCLKNFPLLKRRYRWWLQITSFAYYGNLKILWLLRFRMTCWVVKREKVCNPRTDFCFDSKPTSLCVPNNQRMTNVCFSNNSSEFFFNSFPQTFDVDGNYFVTNEVCLWRSTESS